MQVYKTVKRKLKETGELMIQVADGATFELHTHNTKFDDVRKLIEIDGGNEVYWLNGDEVVYMWIHKHAKEE